MTNITSEDLANIVNDREPDAEVVEMEQKIDLLENARIVIRVSPPVFDRLNREAEFHDTNIESWCHQILQEHLSQLAGKPFISGPSRVSGVSAVKITGPSTGKIQPT